MSVPHSQRRCADFTSLNHTELLSKMKCQVLGCRRITPVSYCLDNFHVLCSDHWRDPDPSAGSSSSGSLAESVSFQNDPYASLCVSDTAASLEFGSTASVGFSDWVSIVSGTPASALKQCPTCRSPMVEMSGADLSFLRSYTRYLSGVRLLDPWGYLSSGETGECGGSGDV